VNSFRNLLNAFVISVHCFKLASVSQSPDILVYQEFDAHKTIVVTRGRVLIFCGLTDGKFVLKELIGSFVEVR